jgi:hypothetical protein
MHLVGWFAVGFVLASFAMQVARQWRRDRNRSTEQPGLLATALAAAVPLYAARSSPAGPPSAPAAPAAPPAPTGNNLTVPLRLLLLLIVAVLLLWFAAESDRANLWESVLWVRSPFLGARFQYLLCGAAFGVVVQLFRTQIAAMSKQAFDATIGSKENTAWVLQGTLAILIIVAATFVIKPDLLNYIRSLEYGGFKATFADHSSTARLADLNYKVLLWGFTLDRYEDFERDYLGEGSERAKFGDRFFYNKVSSERKSITAALFGNYVQPVIKTLICLEKNHPTKAASHDLDLIRFRARWVDFLSKLKSGSSEITFDFVQPFLLDVNQFESKTAAYVSAIAPGCAVTRAVEPRVTAYDAMTIVSNYNKALRKLEADGKTAASFRMLALIDPYLIAAAGDLIVVLNGQQEKAEFLTRMLDGFPKSSEMITAGIINIFYQAADAQLQSLDSWPVDSILTNVDYAIKGVDLNISKTSDLVAVYRDDLSRGKTPDTNPTKFFEAMNRNLMILLAEKLGSFNQRALAGEALSQRAREDWLTTYSRAIANLGARSDAPILAMDNLPPSTVDEQSRKSWPTMSIEPEYLIDIHLAIAISSLLLERTQGSVSAVACNSALYYLKKAGGNVDALVDRKNAEAAADGSPEQIGRVVNTKLQLRRILEIIRNWAGSTCDWSPDLG